MSVALIQGAGGSFGSHFARHLLSCTSLNVVAASRNPDATRRTILEGGGLDEKRLSVLEMDVREEGTIEKAAKQVETRFGGASLRILLNVSGVVSCGSCWSRGVVELNGLFPGR
jgi:NAD(P)-dependent dehydrogenase (short-subunit alcohol dehydrogenase family)